MGGQPEKSNRKEAQRGLKQPRLLQAIRVTGVTGCEEDQSER